MEEQKLPKIAIVGAHCGMAAIEVFIKGIDTKKLESIIIDVDDIVKLEEAIKYMGAPPPVESIQLLKFDKYPKTRAERRKEARQKSRK